MNRETWKKDERLLAKYFGTNRTPLSGGNSRHTRSDSLHDILYLELKKGTHVPKTFSAAERLFAEVVQLSIEERKWPVLVTRPSGQARSVSEWEGYTWWPAGDDDYGIRATPVVRVPMRTILVMIPWIERRVSMSRSVDGGLLA